MTSRSFAWWIAALAAALCAACTESDRCYPTDYQLCSCGDQKGYQRCGSDGQFSSCDCTQTPGTDAGPPMEGAGAGGAGAGGMGTGGLLPFLAPCASDAQCESNLCFLYNAKGPHCTIPCTSPTDCPPPSDGCSGMSVCKAP